MKIFKRNRLTLGLLAVSLTTAMYIAPVHAEDSTTEPPTTTEPDYDKPICTDGMTADMCQAALELICGQPDGEKYADCKTNQDTDDDDDYTPTPPATGSVPNKSNAKIGGADAATLMFSPSAFAAQQAIGFIQAFFTCKNDMSEGEKSLAYRRGANLCVEVGEYCSKKVKVGFIKLCRTKKKTYCCFNSKLARIINQEGRKQLGNVGWGTAKNPRCEGFTIEEFNSIDISKMDLSEFVDEIVANANLNVSKTSDYWEQRNTNRLDSTWQSAESLGDDVATKILSSENPYDVFNQPTDGKARADSTARTVSAETEANTPKELQEGGTQPLNQQQIDQSKQAIIDYYDK